MKLWQHVLDFGTYTPWSASYFIESTMRNKQKQANPRVKNPDRNAYCYIYLCKIRIRVPCYKSPNGICGKNRSKGGI
ncbi:hypothetical protein HanPI659440_Chr09g0352761 [Helianthus annuus]|nr:hypothetical protein HanPI659440_Chr09g0352761 [Helianthus annuus]